MRYNYLERLQQHADGQRRGSVGYSVELHYSRLLADSAENESDALLARRKNKCKI